MARRDDNLQARLDRDLAELKLPEIAKSYREVLDEAARKGSSFLEVLAILIGLERVAREKRALERRLREARLPKQLRSYVRPSLLLLDELGYLPIDKQGADLLFQVVATRYDVGSLVISTNRPFREWGKLFDVDNTLATALIDRLMHHGEGIVIQGDTYRMRDKDPDSTDE